MDTTRSPILRDLLGRHEFRFNKALGQNFLISPQVADDIVGALRVDNETGVLEIGPGAGALTARLAAKAGRVTAVELDERLIPVLREALSGAENTAVIQGDALKVDLPRLCVETLPYNRRVAAANLPYYITVPAISALLAAGCFDEICVMVQKEVVARLTASPGDAALTAFSVEVQLRADVKPLFGVGRHCFLPQPHIDSAVVLLTPRAEQPPAHCFALVKAGYASRRKTLLNNLLPVTGRDKALAALERAGIDPSARAETLDCGAWRRLAGNM